MRVGPGAVCGRMPAKGLELVEGMVPGAGEGLLGDCVGKSLPGLVMCHERKVHGVPLEHGF